MAWAPGTEDQRNAYERRRCLRRFHAGVCRRCPQPRQADGALCATCGAQEYLRRPPVSIRARELVRRWYPTKWDRRQNGKPHAALTWALQMADREGDPC